MVPVGVPREVEQSAGPGTTQHLAEGWGIKMIRDKTLK